jgi:hypothetical protein
VIDIKFTTLELDKTGHASSGHLPYMAQVFVYSEALGLIQGYTPPSGYLLGRGWNQCGERGRDCLDRLARVDLDYETPRGKLSLRKSVEAAICWMRRVRADGADWNVIPSASVDELRPNMSNTVYFGEDERLFRLMPNADFGGNRTVISMPNSGAELAASWRCMANGR